MGGNLQGRRNGEKPSGNYVAMTSNVSASGIWGTVSCFKMQRLAACCLFNPSFFFFSLLLTLLSTYLQIQGGWRRSAGLQSAKLRDKCARWAQKHSNISIGAKSTLMSLAWLIDSCCQFKHLPEKKRKNSESVSHRSPNVHRKWAEHRFYLIVAIVNRKASSFWFARKIPLSCWYVRYVAVLMPLILALQCTEVKMYLCLFFRQ